MSDAATRSILRRYHLAMAAPFFLHVLTTGVFCAVHGVPELLPQSIAMSLVVCLGGGQLAGWYTIGPIREFLADGRPFATIERALTQLPLRSARWMFLVVLPLLFLQLIAPKIGLMPIPAGVPDATWADVVATFVVQLVFYFVLTYFLVSAYLERLCRFLFERRGVNLGLFFGDFQLKMGVALGFASTASLLLLAVEIFSYDGERLMREAAVDVIASVIALSISLYWISRSLTRPQARLDEGITRLADGDLTVRLPVTSNDQVGHVTSEFNRMVQGLRERQTLRTAFGRYVDESVASTILDAQGSSDGRLAAETRDVTVLFTDIEGFTALSEWLPPDQIVRAIDKYLAVVMEPIRRHGGVVNNFIGDGLLVSFNLPLACPDHATAAVAAAIDIQRALDDWRFDGAFVFNTRIGINTGPVIGGSVGAGDRLSYMLLGDTVNTAARLEQLNKDYGTRILVANATRAACSGDFVFAPVATVAVRGRSEPTTIHSVDTRRGSTGPTGEGAA